MNQFVEKLTGMAPLTDQVIATDMLIAAKTGIKNYAYAITEAATEDVRNTLIHHLEDAIGFHQQITNYMVEKGYYNPQDTLKQMQVDLNTAETALKLSNQ